MDPEFDTALFHDNAISPDTRRVTEAVIARMASAPAVTDLPSIREAFSRGQHGIPASPKSPHASEMTIPGPGGDIPLRILSPQIEMIRGVYLHLHGGGWMIGTNDMWDDQLERLGREAGLVCISVDYRLAPEHPFPAATDDCLAAALWLIDNAQSNWSTDNLTIGGESAGAHLAVTTLIGLRDLGKGRSFRAANLAYGCYDLSSTPSVRAATESLIIDRAAIENFALNFGGGINLRDPAISPLYANLSHLPPALFSVGTRDPLLDDSMFMAMRWRAAGNAGELALYPGGLHGFDALGGEIAETARSRASIFLSSHAKPTGISGK